MQNLFKLIFKDKKIIYFLSATFILKIILSAIIPVVGDESYYWFWGQHPQLSYFDHPGMTSWLCFLSQGLTSIVNGPLKNIALRLPFIILSSLTYLIWINYFLSVDKENAKSVTLFSLLYFLNPFLGLGGLLVTPDIPFLFFYSLSFFSVSKIIQTQKSHWYILLGLFLGLGFNSKYHIVLLPLALIFYVVFTKNLKLIHPLKLFLTVLFGFIFSMPVLIWNYQNDFASFLFQLNHGLYRPTYKPEWTISYVVAQVFLFNPFLIYLLIKMSFDKLGKITSLFQWSFFLFSSFKALVEANWPIASHPTALASLRIQKTKLIKYSLIYWSILWVSLFAYLLSPFSQQKIDKFPQTWMAEKIYQETKDYRPLFGPTYQISSLLSYISNEEILKMKDLSRHDFYDDLNPHLPSEKSFYVLKNNISEWPEYISKFKVELVKTIPHFEMTLFRLSHE